MVATPISGVFAALFALIVGARHHAFVRDRRLDRHLRAVGVVNNVDPNGDLVTGGQGSIVGIPPTMNVWIGWLGAGVAIAIAYLYVISRSGLRGAPPATRRSLPAPQV